MNRKPEECLLAGSALLAGLSFTFLLLACRHTPFVRECSKHHVPLLLVRGYDKGGQIYPGRPYEIFPTQIWQEMYRRNPGYDVGLLYERKRAQVGAFRYCREDWICPQCTNNGTAYLKKEYAK